MTRHLFGWSLPPGVTDRMIDEAANGFEEYELPDEHEPEKYECDCCGEMVPVDNLARCWVSGIETFACEKCRGDT